MYERFLEFIKNNQLFESHQKVLLAVSGGIDSMVLLHLFEHSGFDYGIIHCNFQLRGEESDGDEEFLKQQVAAHGVPAFYETFETEEFAEINGISIEMAARELRYQYFEKMRLLHNYDFIATAHHQDDLIETFFLNLSRKTGIKGLTGISTKNGKIIRPLLFAGRKEIEDYATANFIDFREDSTNIEVVYQRNFIRHQILPLFNELNPAFKKNVLASIENLKDTERVYSGYLQKEKQKVLTTENDNTIIDIELLKETPFPETLLFEILTPFNFNSAVADEVYSSLETNSGKQFYSKTHRVIKDRERLFITPLTEQNENIYYIEKGDIELFRPLNLSVEKVAANGFNIIKNSNAACLDFEKLEFPLLIRKWKQGDYFQPLGMSGFKKVSDFFIDEKIPLHEKENTWLLCSSEKIVWIMGLRIDNRFKVTPQSKQVLKIEIN
ncbi:MAG: tRNA lysidine(34) synthetase TilS [Prolixibacteraceae bacterium]|nr:tRNA lysidine(34) synthetase TilS [Prolixibacteraceae bacterium]